MKLRIALVLMVIVSQPAAAAEPVRITADGSFKQHLQWSPDGKSFSLTRIHRGKMAVWTMDSKGKSPKPLLEKETPYFDAQWSADSKKLVFVYDILQGTDGKLQIDSANADGSEHVNVIPHKAFEESPRWSPDGKSLLWVSSRDGNPELYRKDLSEAKVTRLTSEIAFDLHPAWSPDGKSIAFSSGRSGRQKIYVMNADGSGVRKLTDGEGTDSWPAWSPDGKSIAFVSFRAGNNEIERIAVDGSGRQNLMNHPAQDTSPTWSPDGRRIAFISTRHGGSDVYVMEVSK
jgi:TolB protein